MLTIKHWLKSPYKDKKYRVVLSDGSYRDFGNSHYQQYRDSTPLGLYSNLDHRDERRRALYYKRHKTNYGKYTPDWLSKKYLW